MRARAYRFSSIYLEHAISYFPDRKSLCKGARGVLRDPYVDGGVLRDLYVHGGPLRDLYVLAAGHSWGLVPRAPTAW